LLLRVRRLARRDPLEKNKLHVHRDVLPNRLAHEAQFFPGPDEKPPSGGDFVCFQQLLLNEEIM